MDSKKLLLTWDEFDDAIVCAASELNDAEFMQTCTGIYGIPRGGLIIAVALSHHMGLPWLPAPKPHALIVDDVIETGRTFLHILNAAHTKYDCSERSLAAWVWISKNAQVKTGYRRYVDPDTWVVFPWEDWARAGEDKAQYERRFTSKI